MTALVHQCAKRGCTALPERKLVDEDHNVDYLCEEHYRQVLTPTTMVFGTWREMLAIEDVGV